MKTLLRLHFSLLCMIAFVSGSAAADQVAERAAARAIFEEAASSHRAMRDTRPNLTVTILRTNSTVLPLDDATTATSTVQWRQECRADYEHGVLVSETERVSEVFQGVEQVDTPRPVLAYRLCGDCEMKSIRQNIPVLDPNWSVIDSRMEDDNKLVDPIDVMDRVEGGPTADFLDFWSESFLVENGPVVTATSAADGSAAEVVLDFPAIITKYTFSFERIASELRFTSLEQTPEPGSPLAHSARMVVRWGEFHSARGEIAVLPIANEWYSLEPSGPLSRVSRADNWQLLPPAEDQRSFEDYIATQSALIAYDGIAHRLEVESIQREAERAEQNAP